MTGVRSAAVALLGVVALGGGGCHVRRSVPADALEPRAAVYAAVLDDLRRESRADWVVVDTLLPVSEFDNELQRKVRAELPATHAAVDAFVTAQRRPVTPVAMSMRAQAPWSTLSLRRLDSLRNRVRATAMARGMTASRAAGGSRSDDFWLEWQRLFPATAGYVILSPAGMTEKGRAALIHVTLACGSICGETHVRLLRRTERGAWETVRRLTLSER